MMQKYSTEYFVLIRDGKYELLEVLKNVSFYYSSIF